MEQQNTGFFAKLKGTFNLWTNKSSPQTMAYYPAGEYYDTDYSIPVTTRYTAEKNPGELGTIKKYYLDYDAVRNRAWQGYLESDVIQSIVQKMTSWVSGDLKLHPTPMVDILEDEGIALDEATIKKIQRRFNLFSESRSAVYGKRASLMKDSIRSYLNAFVGGDFLVILHIKNNKLQVECVDGQHVYTPIGEDFRKLKQGKNVVQHGIEKNERGEHVAYYVNRRDGHRRIPAKSSTGLTVAYMVYSNLEYRYSADRGLSEIAAILEIVKKLDRYKEATVGGAEERSKVAYTIRHNNESTGVNPMVGQLRGSARANATVSGASETPEDGSIKAAQKIAATVAKQVINLPNGANLEAISSDMEINFKDFFMTNLQIACAAVDIPIEVAMSKFENNFSSSRAAMKMFERTLLSKRKDWAMQFWKPIYIAWLYLEDLRSDINLPGLFLAVSSEDDMIVEAYTSMKMVGPKVPHVDPVKEVEAIRKKLGKKAEGIPLTSIQEAIDELGGNIDFDDFVDGFEEVAERFKEQAPQNNGVPSPEPEPDPEDKEVIPLAG